MASTRRRDAAGLACAGLTLFLAAAASPAQDAPPPARAWDASRPEWGTKDRIFTHVGFNEFTASTEPGAIVQHDAGGGFNVYSVGGGAAYSAVAHVPSGALVTYLELDYCDTNPAGNVSLELFRCNYLGMDCHSMSSLSSSTGAAGCHVATDDLTAQGFTMDNNASELVLYAGTSGGDDRTSFSGAYIGYKLQISPAPASPTFGDVSPSNQYYRAIEALAAAGITGGCGSGNFCPNQNVTRGEMAAFLARALGLHFPN
ncbi:MAG TPA: S-layer homology domain-containing protein [Thermoanaerobaculia bacterium]|jgi:hypothetical protein